MLSVDDIGGVIPFRDMKDTNFRYGTWNFGACLVKDQVFSSGINANDYRIGEVATIIYEFAYFLQPLFLYMAILQRQ